MTTPKRIWLSIPRFEVFRDRNYGDGHVQNFEPQPEHAKNWACYVPESALDEARAETLEEIASGICSCSWSVQHGHHSACLSSRLRGRVAQLRSKKNETS